MRRAAIYLGVWLCLAALAPWPALASFGPEDEGWAGISQLTQALRGAGVSVQIAAPLDFSALTAEGSLAVIGPEAVDADNLMRFVQSGGRLLIADEGQAMAPFLARVGVTPQAAPAPGEDTLGGRPGIRVISTAGLGRLADRASHLVLNHPGALSSGADLNPALRFADGTAFGYHLQIGAGEALVLADPSIFINNMQGAGDNGRFAANVAAWLTEGDRPLTLAGGEVESVGAFRGGDAPSAGDALSALNLSLSRLGGAPPDTVVIRLLVALLLAAGILFVLLIFPGGATRRRTMAEARQQLAPGAAVNGLAGRPGAPGAPPADPSTRPPAP